VQLHAGGEQVRLRLSNRYGAVPVTLASLSVAPALQGPVVSPGARAVRFVGRPTVTLEPDQELISDPVDRQSGPRGVRKICLNSRSWPPCPSRFSGAKTAARWSVSGDVCRRGIQAPIAAAAGRSPTGLPWRRRASRRPLFSSAGQPNGWQGRISYGVDGVQQAQRSLGGAAITPREVPLSQQVLQGSVVGVAFEPRHAIEGDVERIADFSIARLMDE